MPEKHPDIEQYLKSAVDSMISNACRRMSNRDTLRQFVTAGDNQEPFDRIAVIPAPDTDGIKAQEAAAEKRIIEEKQKEQFDEFKVSVADHSGLTALIEAYEVGITKNREIEQLTGIPAAQVAELKRMFDRRMTKFLRNRKVG